VDIDAIQMMPVCNYGRSNYWLSVMTIAPSCSIQPIDIILALEKNDIESRPVWKPMHLQPLFMDARKLVDGTSEELFNNGICLASSTTMSKKDVENICNVIKKNLDN